MITFFTCPRPFVGEFDAIQRRAIRSWIEATPDAEVFLLGDERSVMLAAADFMVFHMDGIRDNGYGTPLINDVFETAHIHASHDLLCEVSADVQLYFDDGVLDTIAGIDRPFVIGQRHDEDANGNRTLHAPYGIDYFIYRKGTLGEIPPFAVGRTGYDNWLVWAAMERWGLTVIDATEVITAVHPDHGRPVYGTREKMLRSDERRANLNLMRKTGCHVLYGVKHAPFVLTDSGEQRRQ